MKFGQYLQDHAVDEWRKAYVNYRLLKKQIGKAEAEMDAVDNGKIRTADEPVSASPQALHADVIESPETAADTSHSGIRGRDAIKQSIPPSSAGKVDLELGVKDDADADDEEEDVGHEPLTSSISRQSRQSDATGNLAGSDDTNKSSKPFVRSNSTFSKKKTYTLTKSGDFNPKNWRPEYSSDMSIKEVVEICPPQCRRFFVLLDRELDRVTSFYSDREHDAVQRYEDLKSQWTELQNHKKEFQAFRAREIPTPKVLQPAVSRLPGTLRLPGSGLVRRALAHSEPQRNGNGGSTEMEAGISALLHGRPEQYNSAKSALKLATFEYYRSLGILKSYRVLNRTGFTKALKKFEKGTRIPCAASYSKTKLDSANFVSSTRLDELIRETEDAFANVFEHGDRKRALERLREFGVRKMHHFTAWRSGLLIGASIPLLIEGLVKSSSTATRQTLPYWQDLLQLFGAMWLPVLFANLFYLNLLAWSYARINWVLIFELDVRTRLDVHQFTEIPALLFFIWSLCFWMSFSNFWPDHIPPHAYPAVFVTVSLFLLLNPLPYLYPSARWWMVRSFSRVITAGLLRVEFRDFFLGDEMNSLYYSMVNLGFFVCLYHHGWPQDAQKICSSNETFASPILASLPPLWRLGQSLRRYLDSDGLVIHMLNAGKYTATIFNFFFYYTWRIYGSQHDARFVFWILFATINSVYTSIWDILLDWSLGNKNAKHFLLRAELGFKDHVFYYYAAIVVDVLLRFSWVIYLAPAPSVQLRGFLVALLELLRRIMWNGFRVESEHIGNVDGYRVTRNVPLPYIIPGASNGNIEKPDQDAGEEVTLRQKVFTFFHKLHEGLVKDFVPLTNISIPFLFGDRSAISRTNTVDHRKKDYQRRQSRGTAPDSSSPGTDGDTGGEESPSGEEDASGEEDGDPVTEVDSDLREGVEDAERMQMASLGGTIALHGDSDQKKDV